MKKTATIENKSFSANPILVFLLGCVGLSVLYIFWPLYWTAWVLFCAYVTGEDWRFNKRRGLAVFVSEFTMIFGFYFLHPKTFLNFDEKTPAFWLVYCALIGGTLLVARIGYKVSGPPHPNYGTKGSLSTLFFIINIFLSLAMIAMKEKVIFDRYMWACLFMGAGIGQLLIWNRDQFFRANFGREHGSNWTWSFIFFSALILFIFGCIRPGLPFERALLYGVMFTGALFLSELGRDYFEVHTLRKRQKMETF